MLLEGKGLSYRYGRNGAWLLRGREIAVSRGEVVGLQGPSGSGKTTLARILAGYLQPHEGTVTLDGRSVRTARGYHPVQMVFQHPEQAVNPRWRMRRTIQEGWQPDWLTLQSLGIEEKWLDRVPAELSGGELQRCCIARALGPETKYLIADEMTAMLDAVTQVQIWHAMLELARERNIGMLIISHDPGLLKRICHRIEPM
ncbi:ABC transporter ATP-binding protein [Paenibacillus tarimensis]|uniref:ABC transporter ATP-binding protein n=1 Tax=Paenibacillus tarimensis TaxID=416012 RepID=UPI001F2C2BA1|nr:ATP-binding cassette domain-containing protein [Paenibacillus tarimensis]MCF2944630.1 ATP-binding cassette domain-containing protein [Paenibacillus tarimensis]